MVAAVVRRSFDRPSTRVLKEVWTSGACFQAALRAGKGCFRKAMIIRGMIDVGAEQTSVR
jgi:hypothetical protein